MHVRQIEQRLTAAVKRAGSQQNLASEWGVTRSYISHLLAGRVPFSDMVLARLGLKRDIVEAK